MAEAVRRDLGVELGAVEHRRVFAVVGEVEPRWLLEAATAALADPLLHEVRLGSDLESELTRFVLVSRLPGVTDDEGSSAHTALADYAGRSLEELRVFAQDLFLIEAPLDAEVLTRVAREGLGNPLVHFFLSGPLSAFAPYAPMVELAVDPTVFSVSLDLDDEQLAQLARERVLHLDLAELRAIRAYFARTQTRSRRSEEGLPSEPTDVELEVFAQTWSEHCKHKEFQAEIQYVDTHRGERFEVNGLFDTYIRAATRKVCDELEAHGQSWVVKVFSDNAGVVRVDEERLFVFKVETHNTPSALDPYGGAITGILGNNRDPLGTGIGGARLLFNTDVLCFGPPDYGEPLLPGQLHPARVMRGVIKGIEDGGNKSGVPTVHGAIVFDGRFSGKPLVYCGTGALVPSTQAGRPAWVKAIEPGDRIVMVGGRVGQDGIHGATFSSAGIDENSPRTAVQVGSPFTQKKVADLLVEACDRGLVRCTTDNGAGGLSSSVGELATLSGGARVELAHVPLKYPGLRPWEILVSESQERMTLAVSPDHLDELFELATELEVEASDVGEFTDSGLFEVLHAGKRVALLDLEFLHDGVPRKRLQAEWVPPTLEAPSIPGPQEAKSLLLTLLESLDIRSREEVIRRYDHEVKGLSVVKALMGGRMRSPQDAAVLRLDHHGQRGLAVSCGICPRFGDLSPYTMSALAFDEAVRQIIAVGGRLPRLDDPKGPWWSACDNFCVPDSVFDSIRNPDGKQKLAALVQMCRALYDVSTEYLVPLTSGKDSMKNDFVSAGRKISVPPTILYSVVAGLDDVDRVVTTELKAGGDFVYLLGETRDELGGSCLLRLSGQLGDEVPRLRPAQARALYVRVGEATRMGLLESCHDLSDGGLGVALAEATFGASLGAEIELAGELGLIRTLFSESPSRFVVSVRPENRTSFEAHFASMATPLGRVTEEPRLTISSDGFSFEVSISELYSAWTRGLGV
ncbi:MAG: phosphoribosylformylglycinamidine synthase [Deltaproteobacteria bacterium]|nr:phosphoribosylformylglycinamidine synthase [Deltaproteobacteria bacterium]